MKYSVLGCILKEDTVRVQYVSLGTSSSADDAIQPPFVHHWCQDEFLPFHYPCLTQS